MRMNDNLLLWIGAVATWKMWPDHVYKELQLWDELLAMSRWEDPTHFLQLKESNPLQAWSWNIQSWASSNCCHKWTRECDVNRTSHGSHPQPRHIPHWIRNRNALVVIAWSLHGTSEYWDRSLLTKEWKRIRCTDAIYVFGPSHPLSLAKSYIKITRLGFDSCVT